MSASERVIEVTCIRCPLGCAVSVEVVPDGTASYGGGASCARGREYALAEAVAPKRSVATVVAVPGCVEPLSVKTELPIPKSLVVDAVRQIKRDAAALRLPVHAGDTVAANLCGTGVAAIATKTLE